MSLTEAVAIISTMSTPECEDQIARPDGDLMFHSVCRWRLDSPKLFVQLLKLCGHYGKDSGGQVHESGFQGVPERLTWLAGQDRLFSMDELCEYLRATPDSIRRAIHEARDQGVAIATVPMGYRIGSRVGSMPPARLKAA